MGGSCSKSHLTLSAPLCLVDLALKPHLSEAQPITDKWRGGKDGGELQGEQNILTLSGPSMLNRFNPSNHTFQKHSQSEISGEEGEMENILTLSAPLCLTEIITLQTTLIGSTANQRLVEMRRDGGAVVGAEHLTLSAP